MKDMIYSQCSQGWYIGITAASQAVKAGSTPVPCSKKETRCMARLFFGAGYGGFAVQNRSPAGTRKKEGGRRASAPSEEKKQDPCGGDCSQPPR